MGSDQCKLVLGVDASGRVAPHDQRTQWAYIFGAICPAKGKGAGLVMPPYNDWGATLTPWRRISPRSAQPSTPALMLW